MRNAPCPGRAFASGSEEEARWHPRTGVRASLYTTAIYLLFACTGVGSCSCPRSGWGHVFDLRHESLTESPSMGGLAM